MAGSGSAGGEGKEAIGVDVGTFLNGVSAADLVIALYFLGFFVLGFAQGTIRRLLGIGSILFSFLFAANVAQPLGDFLGTNWTQFPREYSYMIGFATIFVAASLAFALVVQGFYKPQPLFQRARFADEIIGGLLGIVQAAIIFGAVLVILDTFFRIPGIPVNSNELPVLRDLWGAMDGSKFAAPFRETLIPGLFLLVGLFIPDKIEQSYPLGG